VSQLAVLVPVLARPQRVAPLLASFAQSTTLSHTVYFIPNPDDEAEIAAIKRVRGKILLTSEGGYSDKINQAVKLTTEPLIFLGADDLEPHPGWFRAAQSCLLDGAEVVGVNDLIERNIEHATHFLMTRQYSQLTLLDGSRGPLFEGYRHYYSDNELIGTAQHRGVYAYANDSVVEHLHPMARKAPNDSTYRLGQKSWSVDRGLYAKRCKLWR
jgi:hypothetical protein